MFGKASLRLALALCISLPGLAQAQTLTPRRSVDPNVGGYAVDDSRWNPSAYAVATPATPGVNGVNKFQPMAVATPSTPAPAPPAQTAPGRWMADVYCDGSITICGYASAGHGWGYAIWNQRWTCTTGSCGDRPAGTANPGEACQTSGAGFPLCRVGAQ
jgi:hypothetical protein